MMANNKQRSNQSGKLAEEYMREMFSIVEDDTHEIKGMCAHPGYGLVRFIQLSTSRHKVYWYVKYDTDVHTRKLKSGPRKGKRIREARRTMRQAYDGGHVIVCALTGEEMVTAIVRSKQYMQQVKQKGNVMAVAYWRLHWRWITHDCVPYTHRGVEILKHHDLRPEQLEPPETKLAPKDVDDDIPF